MKYIFLVLLSAYVPFLWAQTPWFNNLYDLGYPGNSFNDILISNDTIVGIGYAYPENSTQQGVFLAKLDTNGTVIQTKMFLDTSGIGMFVYGQVNKIVRTEDGGYVFIASSLENNQAFLYKTDSQFNVEFIKTYKDSVYISNFAYSIINAPNGYLLYGINQKVNYDVFGFIRYVDMQGNPIWEKKYFYDGKDNYMGDLKLINDSTMVFSSTVIVDNDNKDFFSTIGTLDLNGNQLSYWESEIDGEIGGIGPIITTPDGGFLAFSTSVFKKVPFYLVNATYSKITSNFQVEWVKNWHGPTSIERQKSAIKLMYNYNGDILGIGKSFIPVPNAPPIPTANILKISLSGDSLWNRAIPLPYSFGIASREINGGGLLSSGSIIIGGEGLGDGHYYPWLIKLTKEGCLDTLFACTPTSSIEIDPSTSGEETLFIYPNPASNRATIQFPESNHRGVLRFFNALGQELFEKNILLQSGATDIDVAPYPPGLYHIIIELGYNERWTGRLVVARE